MRRLALLAAALAALLSPAAAGQPAPDTGPDLAMPMIGTPLVIAPAAPPTGAVALFSDRTGWTVADMVTARALARAGLVVLAIDLPATLRRMAGRTDPCDDLIGEIEEDSHRIQRALGARAYRFPVLAGVGAGGRMALELGAQAEAATLERVVALDPLDSLPGGRALCPGAPRNAIPAAVIRASAAAPWQPARTERLIEAVLHGGTGSEGDLADLPLVELAVGAPSDSVAILYSGDGGWRDLDKDVARLLQGAGLPVVGVDVLRYFWRSRGPDEAAADLARIIDGYRARWNAQRVVLIGYSFGADILPALYNRLPPAQQAMVAQVSLLGFADKADFEVTVAGWLGGRQPDSLPTLPELRRLPLQRVQCFYGAEDTDAACDKVGMDGMEVVRTGGGHHFDGDYDALARRILDGLKRRSR